VSSLSAFGLSYVMAAVADYAAQYPQVTVDMTLSDRVVELIDEGFDVAIRASPSGLKSSSLIARQIATAHLVLCASPAYLRRHGTPKSVADLARHNYLQYAGVSVPEIATGETSPRLRLSGNLIVNHLEAQRVIVLQGAGIAMLGTEVIGTIWPRAVSCRCWWTMCRRASCRFMWSMRADGICRRKCVRLWTFLPSGSLTNRCGRRSNRSRRWRCARACPAWGSRRSGWWAAPPR
jgi:DNA-binding transcriptional LysR family regulator